MSVVDKLINAMKFNDDDDYDDDEDYEDEDYYGDEKSESQPEPVKATRAAQASAAASDDPEDEEPAASARSRKRFGLSSSADRSETSSVSRQVKKQYSEAGMEVCIIKPTCFSDSKEVTDTILSNSTVVLNLEGLDNAVAQRIIDFISGSCYAVHGNVMEISHYIFVITPANVDVSGDLSSRTTKERSETNTLTMPYGGRNFNN